MLHFDPAKTPEGIRLSFPQRRAFLPDAHHPYLHFSPFFKKLYTFSYSCFFAFVSHPLFFWQQSIFYSAVVVFLLYMSKCRRCLKSRSFSGRNGFPRSLHSPAGKKTCRSIKSRLHLTVLNAVNRVHVRWVDVFVTRGTKQCSLWQQGRIIPSREVTAPDKENWLFFLSVQYCHHFLEGEYSLAYFWLHL